MLAMLTPPSAESIATMYDSLSSKVGGWPFLVGRNLPFKCRTCRTSSGSRWMFTFTISACLSVPAGSWDSVGLAAVCSRACEGGSGLWLPELQEASRTVAATNSMRCIDLAGDAVAGDDPAMHAQTD